MRFVLAAFAAIAVVAAPTASAAKPEEIAVPVRGENLEAGIYDAMLEVCGNATHESLRGLASRREFKERRDCIATLRLESGAGPEALAAFEKAKARLR